MIQWFMYLPVMKYNATINGWSICVKTIWLDIHKEAFNKYTTYSYYIIIYHFTIPVWDLHQYWYKKWMVEWELSAPVDWMKGLVQGSRKVLDYNRHVRKARGSSLSLRHADMDSLESLLLSVPTGHCSW